jgi:hypothetical protein
VLIANACESSYDYGFLFTTAGLAIDKSGKLLLAYHAGNGEKEPQIPNIPDACSN